MSSALYVFCVTHAAAPGPTGDGIELGLPLLRLDQDGLCAIACAVALGDWVGEAGETHLADLSWLGPRAVRHELVIERALAAAAVLPLRFGCLFSGEDHLRDWLRRHHQAIAGFLTRIAGLQEWSLKGWYDPARSVAAILAADPRYQQLPAAPGVRYLREQKLRQEAQRNLQRWARDVARRVQEALAPLCEHQRTLSALPGSASGRSEEVACHQALLLAPAQLDDLQAAAGRLGAEFADYGLRLEWTGPWPPYSFCPPLEARALGALERPGAP